MTQIIHNSPKIILLLFIPLVNYFNFPSPTEKWHFFDLTEARKKWFLERKNSAFSKEQWLELFAVDYSLKIREVISQKTSAKLIIINYPYNEKHLDTLQTAVVRQGTKIERVILLTVLKYEIISNLKNKYLICPICEKITKKEAPIQNSNDSEKEKIFTCCPNHKEHKFLLSEVEQFNEWVIEYYLSSTKKVVEKFLQEKITLTQLVINQSEDIFLGKIQDEILKIIESL